MRPQSCKAKGRRFQQQVCRMVLKAFPALQPDDVRSTSMGAGGEDVLLSPAAQVLFPYAVECKNCETLAIGTAFRQAEAHSATVGRAPVVFFTRNRSPVFAATAAGPGSALPEHRGNVWQILGRGVAPPFVVAAPRGVRVAVHHAAVWLAACAAVPALPEPDQKLDEEVGQAATAVEGGDGEMETKFLPSA